MKGIILAIALIAGGQAFARATCINGEVGYFPTGEYSGEAQREEMRICHNGTFFPVQQEVKHRACLEGEVGYFPTGQYNGEGQLEEKRVCHNGTFFPDYHGDVRHRLCKNGERSTLPMPVTSGEAGSMDVPAVCKNGRFVPLHN